MDPIRPIVPTSAHPAAVERVRRAARAGDERPQDEQPERREHPRGPRPAGPPAVTGDGHIDALA